MATRCCSFEVEGTVGSARAGTLRLTHGDVPTPAFMPVGTYGAVRGVDARALADVGSRMVLSNTFHLWERPGPELIASLGGLHAFMGWDGPILTDSGGYQVFSLRDRLVMDEQGARFASPLDGTPRELTPEKAVHIQELLGVDVAMALDECLEQPATRARTIEATKRTTRWLHRCLEARQHPDRTALFGIVQGGVDPELRAAHAAELARMDLDGVAIGGLSVGEGTEAMLAMVDAAVPELPAHKVRYLMGVGHPSDIAEAVARGVDLFDCVLPTRMGRHGQAYTWGGRINLRNGRFRDDGAPLDPSVPASPASRLPRAYLHHLVRTRDDLGRRLLSLHNLALYQQLVAGLRATIRAHDADGLARWRQRAAIASFAPSQGGGDPVATTPADG